MRTSLLNLWFLFGALAVGHGFVEDSLFLLQTSASPFATSSRGSFAKSQETHPDQAGLEYALAHMTVRDLYPNMTVPRERFRTILGAEGSHAHLEADAIAGDTRLSSISASGRQCGILWFYHVPKCGGTAIGDWLGRLHDAGHIDEVLPLMSMEQVVDYKSFRSQHLEPIIADPVGKLVAVHHHHRGPGLYGFDDEFNGMQSRLEAQGCKLIRVTFLREPEARVTSALFFNKADESSEVQENAFKATMQDESEAEYHNGEIRYILNNKMNQYGLEPFKFDEPISQATWEQSLGAADAILKQFDFVGVSEHLTAGASKIAELIGEPSVTSTVPLRTVNKNSHQDLPRDELPKMIHDACKYDQQLYDRWAPQ